MITYILKIWNFIKGKAKYIVVTLLCGAIAITGGVAGSKNKQLKEADAQIALLQQQIIQRNDLIEKLAAMEAVHCEVSITVKNTAVMGKTTNGDISQEAEQISTYLRGEILDKIKKQ